MCRHITHITRGGEGEWRHCVCVVCVVWGWWEEEGGGLRRLFELQSCAHLDAPIQDPKHVVALVARSVCSRVRQTANELRAALRRAKERARAMKACVSAMAECSVVWEREKGDARRRCACPQALRACGQGNYDMGAHCFHRVSPQCFRGTFVLIIHT